MDRGALDSLAEANANVLERFPNRAHRLVFEALVVLFAAAVVVAVASTTMLVGRASPGFVVWRNLVVPSIGADDWPGMQAGVPMRTVLRTVDGAPVADAAELRRRIGALPPGTVVTYTFARDDETQEVRVPTSRWRWRDLLPVYLPYLLEGMVLLATALVIEVFRPGDVAARAGAMLSGSAGLMLVLALDLFSAGWVQRVYFLVESLVPATLFDFGMSFPEPRRFVRARPWLRPLLYAAFLALGVAQNVLLDRDPEAHLVANDLVYGLAALAGLLAVVSLVATLVRSRNPLARQQVQVVLAGVVLAALIPALGLIAILALGATIPMNALTPFLLLFPLSIGYAVARHDLFAVDRYLRLGLSYAALTVIVFGSYAGFVVTGELWLGHRLPSVLVPLYVLLMMLFLNPLRERIQRTVDRLFYRQRYDYRGTVESTSRALTTYLESDRIAATVLATLVDDVAVAWAVLVMIEDDDPPKAYARPPEDAARVLALLDADPALLARIATLARPVRRLEHASGGSDAALAGALRFADAAGARLLLPLQFEGKPLGVLVVGEKLSGALFSDEDMQLLHTLAHQAALALTNARAYEIIRRTRDELVQAERLAAIGEMSAALAHGIRNPVAGIRLFAELARDDLGDRPQLASTMTDIIAESDRLERRVRSVLDIARPLEVKVHPGDLGALLATLADELRQRAPGAITLALTVDDDARAALAHTLFDAHALRECLETIVVNAFEALGGGGGHVALHASLDRFDDGRAAARVDVADDGPGMDEATSRRVFELFFTTKRSGTGVGLAMAKRLIERQGGTIDVTTAAGRGTTFRIRLAVAG
ncbi:GAF domain-containing protein [Candidatus Binatia bacterium]|nr:GAF domain-containing protein [Candidatus Binatia bacterium]